MILGLVSIPTKPWSTLLEAGMVCTLDLCRCSTCRCSPPRGACIWPRMMSHMDLKKSSSVQLKRALASFIKFLPVPQELTIRCLMPWSWVVSMAIGTPPQRFIVILRPAQSCAKYLSSRIIRKFSTGLKNRQWFVLTQFAVRGIMQGRLSPISSTPIKMSCLIWRTTKKNLGRIFSISLCNTKARLLGHRLMYGLPWVERTYLKTMSMPCMIRAILRDFIARELLGQNFLPRVMVTTTAEIVLKN